MFPFNVYLTLTDGPPTYAGRPGLYKRKQQMPTYTSGALIGDWYRCVKHLTVSSKEGQAHRLIDGSGGYWQSSGSQGKVSNHG